MTEVDPTATMLSDTMLEIERLRARAAAAAARAEEARVLALDIGRRRQAVVTRDDAALALHTDEVWSSGRAAASRTELRRDVGFRIWVAAQDLLAIQRALDAHAVDLDADAQRLRRQADAVAFPTPPPAPVFVSRPGQATTLPTSNPVPRGNR